MQTLFVPAESGPTDPLRRAMLDTLVGEDTDTFSSRETSLMIDAFDHGEIYWASISTDHVSCRVMAESDLGSPDSGIMLSVPAGYSIRKILEALDAAAQVLMRVD